MNTKGEGYTIRREYEHQYDTVKWRIYRDGVKTAFSGPNYHDAEQILRHLVLNPPGIKSNG